MPTAGIEAKNSNGRRSAVEGRPPVYGGSSRLEAGCDLAEGTAQIGADRSHDGDGGDGDECGNQAIFDRRNTGFVFDQLGKKRVHRVLLALSDAHRVARE